MQRYNFFRHFLSWLYFISSVGRISFPLLAVFCFLSWLYFIWPFACKPCLLTPLTTHTIVDHSPNFTSFYVTFLMISRLFTLAKIFGKQRK